MSYSTSDFIPQAPYNISLGILPRIGESPSAMVTIAKNDGAEGIIQFPNGVKTVEVDERDGEARIEIVSVNCFDDVLQTVLS